MDCVVFAGLAVGYRTYRLASLVSNSVDASSGAAVTTHAEETMYEGELKVIEKDLREGGYAADVRCLHVIQNLVEEVKRLRTECARFRQAQALPGGR